MQSALTLTLTRLAWLLLVLGSVDPAWSAEPSELILIAACFPPLVRLHEPSGGQLVRVKPVLPPGANADANPFRPTDMWLQSLADANHNERFGMPVESAWLARLVATNSRLTMADAVDVAARTDVRVYGSDPMAADSRVILGRLEEALMDANYR